MKEIKMAYKAYTVYAEVNEETYPDLNSVSIEVLDSEGVNCYLDISAAERKMLCEIAGREYSATVDPTDVDRAEWRAEEVQEARGL